MTLEEAIDVVDRWLGRIEEQGLQPVYITSWELDAIAVLLKIARSKLYSDGE